MEKKYWVDLAPRKERVDPDGRNAVLCFTERSLKTIFAYTKEI